MTTIVVVPNKAETCLMDDTETVERLRTSGAPITVKPMVTGFRRERLGDD